MEVVQPGAHLVIAPQRRRTRPMKWVPAGTLVTAPIDLILTIFAIPPGTASVVGSPAPFPQPGDCPSSPDHRQVACRRQVGGRRTSAGRTDRRACPGGNHRCREALVMVAFAVPHGAKPTTRIGGQPARATPNKTLFTYTLDSPTTSVRYSMIQQVLDFAPGSSTLKHHRGGAGVTTVIQGQITLNSDGTAYDYGVGQSLTEVPGQDMQTLNRGPSTRSWPPRSCGPK
jgi:quercetin dioxygenase-like cupin family protein